MTMILSSIAGNCAFQVSDRRLTTREDHQLYIFDEKTNKNVVYFARGGIVAIGYSGTAFIGETPTDRWIAEKLCGEDLSNSFILNMDIKPKMWFDVGQATMHLADSLTGAWKGLPKEQRDAGLRITFVGWRKTKKKERFRHVFWDIIRSEQKKDEFLIAKFRRFSRFREIALLETGIRMERDEKRKMMGELKESIKGDVFEYEQAMVRKIQSVSKVNSTVGNDTLAIRICFGMKPVVNISYHREGGKGNTPPKYINASKHKGCVFVKGTKESKGNSYPEVDISEAGFSPWIIGPFHIYPPSFIVGTTTITIANQLPVRIEGPPPKGDVVGALIPQIKPGGKRNKS